MHSCNALAVIIPCLTMLDSPLGLIFLHDTSPKIFLLHIIKKKNLPPLTDHPECPLVGFALCSCRSSSESISLLYG